MAPLRQQTWVVAQTGTPEVVTADVDLPPGLAKANGDARLG